MALDQVSTGIKTRHRLKRLGLVTLVSITRSDNTPVMLFGERLMEPSNSVKKRNDTTVSVGCYRTATHHATPTSANFALQSKHSSDAKKTATPLTAISLPYAN